jgi:hypothetical protein
VVAGQQEDRVREQYGNQVIASAEWRRREVLLAPTPFCRRDTKLRAPSAPHAGNVRLAMTTEVQTRFPIFSRIHVE